MSFKEAFESTTAIEWEDPDDNDGEWPYPTRYVRRDVEGPLADAIRKRLGVDSTEVVQITEAEFSGGWSEYTQETDYEMTISCAGTTKKFDSYDNLGALLKWLDQRPPIQRYADAHITGTETS